MTVCNIKIPGLGAILVIKIRSALVNVNNNIDYDKNIEELKNGFSDLDKLIKNYKRSFLLRKVALMVLPIIGMAVTSACSFVPGVAGMILTFTGVAMTIAAVVFAHRNQERGHSTVNFKTYNLGREYIRESISNFDGVSQLEDGASSEQLNSPLDGGREEKLDEAILASAGTSLIHDGEKELSKDNLGASHTL